MTNNKELKGIGGWLILVAISIVIGPLSIIKTIADNSKIMFNGTFELLTSIDSGYYLPNFYGGFIFEMLGNIIILLLSIYLAYLFFTHNYKTPKVFIVFNLFHLTFVIMDTIMAFTLLHFYDADSVRMVFRSTIYCAIWIPYFIKSVRVKNTFVKGKPIKTENTSLFVQ